MTQVLPKGWEEKTLGEVCEIISGTTPDTKNSKYWGGSNYWITPAELSEEKIFIADCRRKITDLAIQQCSLRPMPKGTVIFSSRAPIGKVAINNVDTLYCNQGFKNFICSKSIYNKFLYYFLKLNTPLLISLGNGTTFKEISKSTISKVNIRLPSLLEQKQIVEKLDKIFANINKAKEQTTQNLKNAQDVFNAQLTEIFNLSKTDGAQAELQDVCAKISAGGDKPAAFSKEPTSQCKIPVYANGEQNDGLLGFTDVPTISQPALTVAARGTIGFTCKRLTPYCPIVRLISLIPNSEKISLDFLFYALKYLIPTGNGTSIPQLTLPIIRKFHISYPASLDLQAKIVDRLNQLFNTTQELEKIYTQKLADLDELKQSVLQQAFSGKL